MQASIYKSKCLCCMSITGPFVNLSNCNHTSFLESFFKYYRVSTVFHEATQLLSDVCAIHQFKEFFSTLVCQTCHVHLINISSFKQQVETCYSMLMNHVEKKTELNYKCNRYRELTHSEPITLTLTSEDAASSPNVLTLVNSPKDTTSSSNELTLVNSPGVSVEKSVTTTDIVVVKVEYVSDEMNPGSLLGERDDQSSGSVVKSIIASSMEVSNNEQQDAITTDTMKLHENQTPNYVEINIKMETDPEIVQESKHLACDECNKRFKSKLGLSCHLKAHLRKHLQCELCSYKANSSYILDRHKSMHHVTVNSLADACGYKWFSNQSSIADPESMTSKSESMAVDEGFSCTKCRFKCHSKKELKTHIAKKHKMFYACAFCDFTADKIFFVTRHLGCHLKYNPFTCKICGQGSLLKQTLMQHMTSHFITSGSLMECSCCGLKLKQQQHVTNHMWSHVRYVPHACYVCNVKCEDQRDLLKHLRTHKDYKPYSCGLCPYKSTSTSDLRMHAFKHKAVSRRKYSKVYTA